MTTGPQWRVDNPTASTLYIPPSGYWVIPNNATTITCRVQCYNSSNALTTVSTLSAIVRNITTSTNANTFTGSTAQDVSANNTTGVNGTNVFAAAFQFTGTWPSGGYALVWVDSYTGRPYSQLSSYNGSAFNNQSISYYNGTAWVTVQLWYYNGTAWVQEA